MPEIGSSNLSTQTKIKGEKRMQIIDSKVPIKMWSDFVSIEEQALAQIKNVSQMPFVHHHIAIMPDAHYGIGATVGSVIPTTGAVIPAAVGVDIGCGMMAAKTSLTSKDLPERLHALRLLLEEAIPVGFKQYEDERHQEFFDHTTYQKILDKHPAIKPNINPVRQIGTLGGGNHFIELCLDTNDSLWVMLHSGSRGVGNRIGTYFIEKAKKEMEKYHIINYLPDKDLAYLVEYTELFDDYIEALNFAQKYAEANRKTMMITIKKVLEGFFAKPFDFSLEAINCHHNYTTKEHHFGKNVWLTRKGAVDASKDKMGIIPGSMGARSFIVRGLGNPQSFNSCSHGAGRVMSRTQAKKAISLEEHLKDTDGVECRKDIDVIDESPKAYKNIDDVMKSQEDLVEIVYELKQILCIKG